jgi:hypothetical protein
MQRPSIAMDIARGKSQSWLVAILLVPLAAPTAFAIASVPPVARPAKAGQVAATCAGETATIPGTGGDDRLIGTPGSDVIAGFGGDDRIVAKGGDDLICAGTGADTIKAGAGADRLYGGAGQDVLRGEGGDDSLVGGRGSDRCLGGRGENRLAGCERTPSVARIGNLPPSAHDTAVSTDEDSAMTVEVAAAGEDPDGDSLRFSAVGERGSGGATSIVDGGARLRFDPVGRFDSLNPGEAAQISLPFTVEDDAGARAEATLKVTVHGVDDSPAAVADEATVEENAGITAIPVLQNDEDVDGGPRSVASVTDPEHGTATSVGGGVEYLPDPGYCNDGEAADSFSYALNGGSSATVRVRVACITAVTTDQGLFPEFTPGVSDYTVRCNGSPLEVSGRLAADAEIAIDGQEPLAGPFQSTVPLAANQEFEFEVLDGGEPQAYHVRCLPPDFPTWEYEQLLQPRHGLYVVTPALGAGAKAYAIVFDDHGVPLWWYGSNPGPIDAKFLANGQIAWWSQFGAGDGYQIRALDGTVEHTVSAVGGSTDIHELQQEPNGDYLVISYQPREHVDLTAFGGGADETVVDAVVEEIDSAGQEVWSWSTQGHIGLEETGRWWPTALAKSPHDIVHMNAVEPVGDDAILISLRHTDAVYKVDKTSGKVLWKLGGTWTPKSLTVSGDPQGAYPLGGQHDVRLQPDGTISIHDNDTNLPNPPRVVRYEIDEEARTATMVEALTDPKAPSSFCCGSARRSSDGSWLISWGGNSLVTEFDAAGQRTFRLGFGGSAFSYRATAAAENSAPDAAALRAGMDAMHPRSP